MKTNLLYPARAIQDQLLKDFASKSEFSDWFSRDDAPQRPVVTRPNPRNVELQEKISQLEFKIKR
jgi:kinetochore protein Mis13/DSN1